MAVVLALISAAAWGISDFCGGTISKRHGPWVTAIAVQLGALAGTLVAAALIAGSPKPSDWAWGAGAGLGVGSGTAFLFRGLSSGRMGVVAPVSAVGSALVPVLVALAEGERPGRLAALGICLALPAIWLTASAPAEADSVGRPTRIGDAIFAGLGFGAGFVGLDRISPDAGLTPLIATQIVSLVPVVVLALWTKEAFWPRRRAAWTGALIGPIGTGANACVLWAMQAGMLSVVSVLVSLYPAMTVALATLLLHERVHRVQACGLALAATAVALISV